MISPNHLRFAVAFATTTRPQDLEGFDSPHGQEVQDWFLENGLIDWTQSPNAVATPRLYAWLEHLCAQPLPDQEWVVKIETV